MVGRVGTLPRPYAERLIGAVRELLRIDRMNGKGTYGITAVRWVGTRVVEAMMGLFDGSQARWALRPAPTRVTEVVDRLAEGDTVLSVFPDGAGQLQAGPEVKVDLLPGGTESLAFDDEATDRRLDELPRF